MIVYQHGKLVYRIAPGATCEIVDIEVESEYRGLGIGRKLLEMLFRTLHDRAPGPDGKVETVYAITRHDNEIAQEFYEATKFRVVGVLRRFYSPHRAGVDAIMYGRKIEGVV